MTKISALTPLGDDLAVGDQFIIRDIDDTGTPNKSVTISGITRGLDRGTNAAPAIAFAADKNTGIYSPGEDQLAVATNGTGRLFIDANGSIGVGTSSPTSYGSGITTGSLNGSAGSITDFYFNGVRQGLVGTFASNEMLIDTAGAAIPLKLLTNSAERARIRADGTFEIKGGGTSGVSPGFSVSPSTPANSFVIDSSGRLLVGTSTSSGPGSTLQVRNDASAAAMDIFRSDATTGTSIFGLNKSRGTAATPLEVADNDVLGYIAFRGYDGTTYQDAAYIHAECDGTWTDGGDTSDNPGALVFSTTADGASSPTERMRITAGGDIHIGTESTSSIYDQTSVFGVNIGKVGVIQIARNNDSLLLINRIGGDGNLVLFSENGTLEGTISVSGTTVSYNGAHLSRWSQLPTGAERTEILRGSVLSNIDEMCEWGDEENEQLNRMKVSTVQGDKNVSGVFQCWDDDDDTYINDFYCAMTGDFIIRIAEGVTVERGDLLMSAGDGTAKPQDDDIIRSKTVAKVTSTNVSCTYEDGSYCVPCVLMAC